MKKTFIRAFILYIALFANPSYGQGPIGSWRDHYSYRSGHKVTAFDDKVFVAVPNGFIQYEQSTGSVDKFSTVDGLNSVDISAIAHSPFSKLLVVGYENGNLDLIFEGTIVNLPHIMQKAMQGSKRINDIFFFDQNKVLLSTGFGIIVLNTAKKEFSDTYFIGDGGSELVVWQTIVYEDRIYAATDQGVYSASVHEPNLFLYTHWMRHTEIPSADTRYNAMAVFKGNLVVNESRRQSNSDVIRVFNGVQWNQLPLNYSNVTSIKVSESRLGVSSSDGIAIYKNLNAYPQEITSYGTYGSFRPQDIYLFESDDIAVADSYYGMVLGNNGSWKTVLPNGPSTDKAFYVYPTDSKTYMAVGGRTDTWANQYSALGYHEFSGNSWGTKYFYDYFDAVRILQNPYNPDEIYLSSWGDGVVVLNNGQVVEHYTPDNSPLQSILPGRYCRISGVVFDKNQNLWVANTGVPNVVSVRSADGQWKGFDYQSLINTGRISEIVYSPYDNLWIISGSGGGFLVIDPGDNPLSPRSHTIRAFRPVDPDGESLSADILSMVFDRDGYLWAGTAQGVLVSYNPRKVFEKSEFTIQRVKVPDVLEGYAAHLLEHESVTAIAIDGANRKWFGTMRSGVFLHSSDGVTQLQHFNEDNSPLPSNSIKSIGIDPKTGEVFFATDKGVVSYRGEATEPGDRFGKVYAFPNPVRPDYHGPITITGLKDRTTVKITDASGNLVYETKSLGGQAIWDGKNRYGERVTTGVYLYFCSDRFGEETAVGKILFIR